MAIVNMSKFSLFSFDEDRKNLIDELMKFKNVHISDPEKISEEEDIEKLKMPIEIEKKNEEILKYEWMIDSLSKKEAKKKGLSAMKEGLPTMSFEDLESYKSPNDLESVYKDLKNIEGEISKVQENKANLNSLLSDIEPWEDLGYRASDLKSSDKLLILTGTVPGLKISDLKKQFLNLSYSYLDEISLKKGVANILLIIHRDEEEKAMDYLKFANFQNVRLKGNEEPKKEIASLKEKIKATDDILEAKNHEITSYTKYLDDIKIMYEKARNEKLKLSSSESFLSLRDINILIGYVPADETEAFRKRVECVTSNYYVEFEAAKRDDDEVPILLRNNSIVSSFESLTSMYALPKYGEIDPTPLLTFFYWVFFGMMVADFGYGLLMTIACGIAIKLFNLDEGNKNFLKFFFFLGISTTIWGLIYGSVFGLSLPFKLIDTNNTNSLLILSIIFGGVHLFFGMGIKGYMLIRDGKPLDAVYDVLLWYMALFGAIGLLLSSLMGNIPPLVGTISKWVMIVGMVGIVLFGARDTKNPFARLAGGLYSLYGISSWIGDFVSYSRLMALGLAGGFISVAINMIIGMVATSPVGIFFGAIIFVGGHLFNAFLSYLSAYVHTARLTYVEFFGKFYEGGGKTFNLFREKPKYINIK